MRYDVVGVTIETGHVRIISGNLDKRNAEAVMEMAVMRRGVEREFFSLTEADTYLEGEKWTGQRGVQR